MNSTRLRLCALSVLGCIFFLTSADAASRGTFVDHTDFVVTDTAGNPVSMTERTVDDVDTETTAAGEPITYTILGTIGTFWTANHRLAYVRTVGSLYQLVYKDVVVATSRYKLEQLGDITSELAYCETKTDGGSPTYVAHFRGKEYVFSEPICSTTTLSNDSLISYASRVYINGVDSGFGVANGNGSVLRAFLYKRSLVYIPTTNKPFVTTLLVGNTKLAAAEGAEGTLLDAAVQGNKLVYSVYKPEAGWSVVWGGEVMSRFHPFITGFLKNAKKLTYTAMTPKGVMLFRGNKVYGVGFDTIRFIEETNKGNVVYVTSKTTQEEERTGRRIVQDVLWFNGTKLLQSLRAENYFAKTVLIGGVYPLVVVETLDNRPQYIWYQGRVGLRGQKIVSVAEDGEHVALLAEHTDGSREIVYLDKEQGQ